MRGDDEKLTVRTDRRLWRRDHHRMLRLVRCDWTEARTRDLLRCRGQGRVRKFEIRGGSNRPAAPDQFPRSGDGVGYGRIGLGGRKQIFDFLELELVRVQLSHLGSQ